jgi:hypothetical protein
MLWYPNTMKYFLNNKSKVFSAWYDYFACQMSHHHLYIDCCEGVLLFVSHFIGLGIF